MLEPVLLGHKLASGLFVPAGTITIGIATFEPLQGQGETGPPVLQITTIIWQIVFEALSRVTVGRRPSEAIAISGGEAA